MTIHHRVQDISVQPNRVRTILALLALSCGKVVSTEQFVDELWAERPPTNTRNALQASMTRLRRLLQSITGPNVEVIRTSTNGYLLDLPPESVDSKRFDGLASRGAALLSTEPARAYEVLESALRIWRGTALLDVNSGALCRSEAVRLTERRLDVRKQIVEARLAIDSHHGLVSELKQLVAEHPSDERLSELLMVALYRSGRQSDALAAFHAVRSWLASEFGLEPGPRLRQMQQAILNQDNDLERMPDPRYAIAGG
ncbi:AfsR/SARP family transcriptional regulator [Actinoplanes sp. NPDC051346]|uniref:AfsR/SARP family transcriptional regulator n=1 Tax=Actinoplanes sp. NPDC051346 TaxID=3155048 RepID=UPI00341B96DB